MSVASEIRAARAFVELYLKDRDLRSGLDRATGRLQQWGQRTTAIFAGVAASLSGAFGTLSLAGSVKTFADFGTQMNMMQKETRVSVEDLSTLAYAAQQTNTSLEDVSGGFTHMARFMMEANQGNGESIRILNQLGLTLGDLNKLGMDEQFKTFAGAIGKTENALVGMSQAQSVFGRGSRAFLGFLKLGKSGIEALQAEARKLGLEMNGEQAKAANDLGDAWGALLSQWKMGVFMIGGALAPELLLVTKVLKQGFAEVLNWIAANKRLVLIVAAAAAGVLTLGAAITALGAAGAVLATIVGGLVFLKGIVLAVAGAIFSVPAIVIGIGAYLFAMSETGQKAFAALKEALGDFLDFVKSVGGSIADALEASNFDLAWQIALAGMKVGWLSAKAAFLDYLGTIGWHWTKWIGDAALEVGKFCLFFGLTLAKALAWAWDRGHAKMEEYFDDMQRLLQGGASAAETQASKSFQALQKAQKNDLNPVGAEERQQQRADKVAEWAENRAKKALDEFNALKPAERNLHVTFNSELVQQLQKAQREAIIARDIANQLKAGATLEEIGQGKRIRAGEVEQNPETSAPEFAGKNPSGAASARAAELAAARKELAELQAQAAAGRGKKEAADAEAKKARLANLAVRGEIPGKIGSFGTFEGEAVRGIFGGKPSDEWQKSTADNTKKTNDLLAQVLRVLGGGLFVAG